MKRRMKEPKIQVEDQMMMKHQLQKGTVPETYGNLRRSMMRDGQFTKTKDGMMTRLVKIKALKEIM